MKGLSRNMRVFCSMGFHSIKDSGHVIVQSPDSIEVMVERRCKRCGRYVRDSEVGSPNHPKVRAAAQRLGWKPKETLQLALLDEWGDRLHTWEVADMDVALDAINAVVGQRTKLEL